MTRGRSLVVGPSSSTAPWAQVLGAVGAVASLVSLVLTLAVAAGSLRYSEMPRLQVLRAGGGGGWEMPHEVRRSELGGAYRYYVVVNTGDAPFEAAAALVRDSSGAQAASTGPEFGRQGPTIVFGSGCGSSQRIEPGGAIAVVIVDSIRGSRHAEVPGDLDELQLWSPTSNAPVILSLSEATALGSNVAPAYHPDSDALERCVPPREV